MFAFDGLWLDMNEATGFCNGECPTGTTTEKSKPAWTSFLGLKDDEPITNKTWWYGYGQQQNISTFDLPFIPGKFNLDNMSISLNATHANGISEYDVHSMFGHVEGKTTHDILTNQTISPIKDKRTFLLSRSTFAGSGAYMQHWLGDNHRTTVDMENSVAQVMNFNMFGIPMVGPDTCGFFSNNATGDFSEEICARWIQIATFYPFARQHRDINELPNEPYTMKEPYANMSRNALFDRLQFTRQMYTCLFEASQSGGSCYDPLFFHYPENENLHMNYTESIMVANQIMYTPVYYVNQTMTNVSFPLGNWVSLNNFSDIVTGGNTVEKEAPLDTSATVLKYLKPGGLIQW
jgi:alpha-glucosidase (family GH31 glycosyl hydrolase)